MDKVFSHTFNSTVRYLATKESTIGINCISFEEISEKLIWRFLHEFFCFSPVKVSVGNTPFMNLKKKLYKDFQKAGEKSDTMY